MTCVEIEFGTPAYDELIRLRYDILRKPLDLFFDPEDIALEYNMLHLGCYTETMELVAGLVLKPLEEGKIQMKQVAVAATHQRKGLGSILVKASEILAVEKGFHKMTMNARETALPFYIAIGYKKLGKRFTEVGIPHFKMEKELNQ